MGYLEAECAGCIAHMEERCSMSPMYNSLACPCLLCLVKGLCRQDCEAIEDYIEASDNFDNIYNSDDERFYEYNKGG